MSKKTKLLQSKKPKSKKKRISSGINWNEKVQEFFSILRKNEKWKLASDEKRKEKSFYLPIHETIIGTLFVESSSLSKNDQKKCLRRKLYRSGLKWESPSKEGGRGLVRAMKTNPNKLDSRGLGSSLKENFSAMERNSSIDFDNGSEQVEKVVLASVEDVRFVELFLKSHHIGFGNHRGIVQTCNEFSSLVNMKGRKRACKNEVEKCDFCKDNLNAFLRSVNSPLLFPNFFDVKVLLHHVQYDLFQLKNLENEKLYFFHQTIVGTKLRFTRLLLNKTALETSQALKEGNVYVDLVTMGPSNGRKHVIEQSNHDNGGEFKKEFQIAAEEEEISTRFSSSRHPESQGVEERNHCMEKRAILVVIQKGEEVTEEILEEITKDLNESRHGVTNFEPIKISKRCTKRYWMGIGHNEEISTRKRNLYRLFLQGNLVKQWETMQKRRFTDFSISSLHYGALYVVRPKKRDPRYSHFLGGVRSICIEVKTPFSGFFMFIEKNWEERELGGTSSLIKIQDAREITLKEGIVVDLARKYFPDLKFHDQYEDIDYTFDKLFVDGQILVINNLKPRVFQNLKFVGIGSCKAFDKYNDIYRVEVISDLGSGEICQKGLTQLLCRDSLSPIDEIPLVLLVKSFCNLRSCNVIPFIIPFLSGVFGENKMRIEEVVMTVCKSFKNNWTIGESLVLIRLLHMCEGLIYDGEDLCWNTICYWNSKSNIGVLIERVVEIVKENCSIPTKINFNSDVSGDIFESSLLQFIKKKDVLLVFEKLHQTFLNEVISIEDVFDCVDRLKIIETDLTPLLIKLGLFSGLLSFKMSEFSRSLLITFNENLALKSQMEARENITEVNMTSFGNTEDVDTINNDGGMLSQIRDAEKVLSVDLTLDTSELIYDKFGKFENSELLNIIFLSEFSRKDIAKFLPLRDIFQHKIIHFLLMNDIIEISESLTKRISKEIMFKCHSESLSDFSQEETASMIDKFLLKVISLSDEFEGILKKILDDFQSESVNDIEFLTEILEEVVPDQFRRLVLLFFLVFSRSLVVSSGLYGVCVRCIKFELLSDSVINNVFDVFDDEFELREWKFLEERDEFSFVLENFFESLITLVKTPPYGEILIPTTSVETGSVLLGFSTRYDARYDNYSGYEDGFRLTYIGQVVDPSIDENWGDFKKMTDDDFCKDDVFLKKIAANPDTLEWKSRNRLNLMKKNEEELCVLLERFGDFEEAGFFFDRIPQLFTLHKNDEHLFLNLLKLVEEVALPKESSSLIISRMFGLLEDQYKNEIRSFFFRFSREFFLQRLYNPNYKEGMDKIGISKRTRCVIGLIKEYCILNELTLGCSHSHNNQCFFYSLVQVIFDKLVLKQEIMKLKIFEEIKSVFAKKYDQISDVEFELLFEKFRKLIWTARGSRIEEMELFESINDLASLVCVSQGKYIVASTKIPLRVISVDLDVNVNNMENCKVADFIFFPGSDVVVDSLPSSEYFSKQSSDPSSIISIADISGHYVPIFQSYSSENLTERDLSAENWIGNQMKIFSFPEECFCEERFSYLCKNDDVQFDLTIEFLSEGTYIESFLSLIWSLHRTYLVSISV